MVVVSSYTLLRGGANQPSFASWRWRRSVKPVRRSSSGAVIVSLDHRLVTRELTYLLNDSEANTLIIGANYLDLVSSVRSELSTVKNFFCIGQSVEYMQNYDELISSHPSTEPDTYVDEDDLAMLLYTSGTTGLPKGAMTTQRNLVAAMMNMIEPLSAPVKPP